MKISTTFEYGGICLFGSGAHPAAHALGTGEYLAWSKAAAV